MRPYKAKSTASVGGQKLIFKDQTDSMGAVRIQAIYYDNTNLDQHVRIYDGDGDECMFPMPGQEVPRVISLESPVTVKLPLAYLDEDPNGDHAIIIFGEKL